MARSNMLAGTPMPNYPSIKSSLHQNPLLKNIYSIIFNRYSIAVLLFVVITIYQSEFKVLVIITTVLLYFGNLIFLFLMPYLSDKS